jgi:ABC-type multidrug transport system fused ATPase/permease subunit
VQRADVVHVIDEGRLVASGTFKELRRTVPMIQEYVRLMSFDEA